MKPAILLMLVIAWSASGAWAKTYYVSPDGNDQQPGVSHATAWRTLSHAISRVGPGDTIYVGAGRYQGQLYMNRFAGTEAAPIRFIADTTGEHLRNDGGVVELVNGSGLLYMKDSHHVHFIGFHMESNSGTLVYNDGSNGLVFEDCTIVSGGGALHANRADNWVVRRCDITANGHGVYAASASMTLTDTTIRVTNTSNSPLHGANNSTLSADRVTLLGGGHVVYLAGGRLTLTNAVLAGGRQTAIHGANSPAVTLVQCTVYGVGGDGIYAAGGRWTIRNTIISNPRRYAFFRANNAAFHESHGLYHGWGQALAYGFTPSDPVLEDPGFVNAGGGDFRLAAGSPAIDAGADMSAHTTVDRLGLARPHGAGWDIGAFEFASEAGPEEDDGPGVRRRVVRWREVSPLGEP
ncbi:MAG: right-handed parallel beta-helix repeat-containing protein [Phycisphaerales bacterium]|nr:right-handed parallel beta-helix repeat-containing protein [Planctomycetota bacterium]MCH8508868.1 right-handed parallel beta-helix repeat-containing protein [Phycisphaerales bacterium]